MQAVMIAAQEIKLGSFLKLAGCVATGGQAKELLKHGDVHVNGLREKRRGRKLRQGDVVDVGTVSLRVEVSPHHA